MATRERPLSPHLQVYKWQAQMTSSILHRATGVCLAFGALLVTGGLLALSAGPERWSQFLELAGSIPGRIVLLGVTWALAYHLLNGIRHLFQDGGMGFSIPQFVRSSMVSMIGSVLLTALAWGAVWLRWGHA